MQNIIKIKEDLLWVGANTRKLALFESIYPIPAGVSYNSYLLLDEKTVLLDTIERAVSDEFFENVKAGLNGRNLDYLIVQHMEPDHCSQISNLVEKYPNLTLVCNKKTEGMLKNFFELPKNLKFQIVAEGDILETGRHKLTFVFAPMVHWPEVMVTYDTVDKILFSADAFGTFGAISGNIFADEVDFDGRFMDEARRYYTNIVGKYGNQVQSLLKKASKIEIDMICPLHGFIWRKNISHYVDKYINWATYTPEEKTVLVAYASIYDNTKNSAEILASELAKLGVKNIKMFDVSITHPSYVLAEAFRCSHIVLASPTYNAEIFTPMDTFVRYLVAHNLQNRTFALIENGSWALFAQSKMRELLSNLKNTTILEKGISINSSVKKSNVEEIKEMAKALADSIFPKAEQKDVSKIDKTSVFSISYGLFVLSTKHQDKDNACIINTVQQLTDSPLQISVTVNKQNYTHDLIEKSKEFNVSVLSVETPFSVFENFGFQTGRNADKFENFEEKIRLENGIYAIDKFANAYYSAKVVNSIDLGTHTMFIAEVYMAKSVSNAQSLTYDYYFKHVKPNPNNKLEEKKGWVCKICGYIYESDPLPSDYICPICKHGASDFEKLN